MTTKTGHGLEECGYEDCTGPNSGNRNYCGNAKDTVGEAKITQESTTSDAPFKYVPSEKELEQLHKAEVREIEYEAQARNAAYAKEKTEAEKKQAYQAKRMEKHAAIVAKNNQRAKEKALRAINSLEAKAYKRPEKPEHPGMKSYLAAHAKDFLIAFLMIMPLPIPSKMLKSARKKALKPLTDYNRKRKSYARAIENYNNNAKQMRYNLAKMRRAYNSGDHSQYRQRDPDYYTYVYSPKKAS